MNSSEIPYRELFGRLRSCVIVPTYNNGKTIAGVLNDILEYTPDIIVVDDGSTDETPAQLQGFKNITHIRFPKNMGKGYALRKGFEKAREMGFDYAISMDSDGQHFASDLPGFLSMAENEPGTLLVGARNMVLAGAPSKSNFGLRFSNFWFTVTTGLRLPDTQCGYRLYPLEKLKKIRFITRRFEFEVEVLVRAAWRKIRIKPVPVKVYYPAASERVSHFRPFTDFLRISLLNTVLVLLALLVFRPYLFFSGLTRAKIRSFIRRELFNPQESNGVKVASVMVGAFMAVAPVWGWQMAIALGIAIAFRLNKIIVLAASNISIPPMIPIILYLSYISGGIVMGNGTGLGMDEGITFEFLTENLFQYVVGSVVFGAVLAGILGIITYVALLLFRKKQPGLKQHNPGS
jgi:glycosyltransferase involved in cell wall biosynthesis